MKNYFKILLILIFTLLINKAICQSFFSSDGFPDNPNEIKNLYLENNDLELYKDSLYKFTSLISLSIDDDDFDNNQIDIPVELFKLTTLEHLYVRNSIETLPEGIDSLKSLKYLELAIDTFPDEFCNLLNLKKLKLRGHFYYVSNEINQLSNLTYLILVSDNLKELPENFKKLKNLKSLELADCNFFEIPNEIFSIESIEYLFLNRNKISKIPDEIVNLKNLKQIHLYHNFLSDEELNKIKKIFENSNVELLLTPQICNNKLSLRSVAPASLQHVGNK
jgi:Leucine-rich repeat (LRR) protein